ncbi:MAG: LysR family transcriptional regulator substrate-binding protein, partial [Sphingobium sp.]
RLGILTTLPGEWMEHFLARQRAEATDERIELVEGRERDLMERLARGRIDLALTLLRRDDGRMARVPLFTEGYSLAMSARHPLATQDKIEGAELADNVMLVRRHCELLPDTSRWFTARGVRPFFAARTTSDDQALRLVRAGLGVTVMPDCFTAPGVVRPRLADFPFMREVGLLFAPHADAAALRERPSVRILIETIEAAREE